ncbi:hypothetical protein OG552_25245 [Streptomyces sp. NBC_01476]|uniref:hypothetical protein n=1 Tax=Streptomyces sp. NBC_01476 TaxID=2903881 RepID=UPI002E37F23E|nr:hypothetical protein [Streptomyces sp. NBC_01476]
MLVSVSAVVLLGLLIWFLVHIRYLRLPDVVLSGTFGFLLAATGAAPLVRAVLTGLSAFLGQLSF